MQKRYFRTSSFYPAAFLLSQGMELVNIDRITDSRRSYFVFSSPERCEELIDRFTYGREGDSDVMTDARQLISSIRLLKEKLYQTNA